MSKELNVLGASGLKFFGTITASISHELKNVLAIVGENAGLLSDLIVMAEKGSPINVERLGKIADTIQRSVKRSDGIIKNLNKFAHSVDHEVGKTDLGELIVFACALFARLASMRGVTLAPVPPTQPVIITTHTFFLEQLLWRCIDVGINAAGKEKTVRILTEHGDPGALIRLTGLDGLRRGSALRFPSEGEEEVLDLLKAKITSNGETGELLLEVSA